jgi:hypothetical protein
MIGQAAIILAEYQDFGRVVKCECGAIHLQVGAVNVSFSPDAYMQFADLVRASALNFEGAICDTERAGIRSLKDGRRLS